MKINSLCRKLGIPYVQYNHDIFLITDDSKDCIDNSIFFAIAGNRVDGHTKIEEAIQNGAKTIVLENKCKEHKNINYIYTKNTKRMLGLFLAKFYKDITKNIHLIGIVGTNGKTTTSTLIYKYLEYIHKKAMLIGSNGCYARGFYKKHNNTTPRGLELYSYFSYAKYHHIKYIIMEVSSIAISELRVFNLKYDVLIYTNFSEDHLDYHKNMDRYLFAKAIPFYKLEEKSYAILNGDDAYVDIIAKHSNCKIITYGIEKKAFFNAKNVYALETGLEFDLNSEHIHSNLIGKFNVYNILPLFGICKIYHLNDFKIKSFLEEFKRVEGRMNEIVINNKRIIIDYAHTEEATRNAILATKDFTKGEVYVVLGCGGNREIEKREKIGILLSKLNCKVILTTDNPRFESPKKIIEDILKGIPNAISIENRKKAIYYALTQVKEDDTLLILGKGAEDYIDVLGHKEKYSDFETIQQWARDNLSS